ncbi:fungal specific transcription factor [Colletotrichum karsti]|uniref:Fungal specific transcription factor n=1 Tax=Colletotrichum karsti TaxID=1095194 RepID=A0A9P6I8C4_9PEZI|nr:fungal specific transcription factor [Colletotrichum karsti]KAF9878119.1 fungal specific transcription factor [Colletotrichum karsti]
MIQLQIPRPPSATGFLFGSQQQSLAEKTYPLGVEECYEILADGFAVYADVMAFVYKDGRKAPGMCAAENCPWVPDSKWARIRQDLEAWRTRTDDILHYPTQTVGAHAGTGCRAFVYINLLYYHCILMLHREYFPFLPKPNAEPQGPTDPPFLEAEAPPQWWQESARELFEAAGHVATILHDASEWGLTMMTPVPGFCGFSACYLNLYALYFPNMTAGHSPMAKDLLDMGLEYLKEFRKAWDLGEGWIKTIQNASLLFEQVNSNADQYRHTSRRDFEALHLSAHEFRTVDRSEQHMALIRDAQQRVESMEDTDLGNGLVQDDAADLETFDPVALMGDHALWPTWNSAFEVDTFGSGL